MNSLLTALLACRPGSTLIQFHDWDGRLLRELHSLARQRGLPIEIEDLRHEVTVGVWTIVVHDMGEVS